MTSNGYFFVDDIKNLMYFSSNMTGQLITIKYISDGLATEEEKKVHKFAEEAVYTHVVHAIMSTRANVQEYLINRFKREKRAAKRMAKLRLSNLKLEEIAQIMKNKGKKLKS
jgi:hypothetical protein